MSKKETTKEEVKDYGKFQFSPEEVLEINAGLLGQIGNFMNALLEAPNIGCHWLTEPRYDYVNKETSELAKPNTSPDKLKEQYNKVLSVQRTINAPPTQTYTNIGKQLMYFLELLSKVQVENIDLGKGFIPQPEETEMEKV